MDFDRIRSSVNARLTVALAVLAAVTLASAAAQADGELSPTVADATVRSSPISIFQAAYAAGDSGRGALWIAFTNRSREMVQRFVVRGRWMDRAGVERASFSAVTRTIIGPGERTTATIGDILGGPVGSRLEIAVDRVRFDDMALWTAPHSASAPAIAEVAPIVSQRAVVVAPGTSLNVRLLVPVDSETAGDGDVVPFVAERDVVVDGGVVVARGALGYGHLDDVGRAANWGRSGTLRFVADAVTAVDGTTIKLRGGQRVAPPRVRPRFVIDGMFVKGRPAMMAASAPLVVASFGDNRVSVGPATSSAALTPP